MLTDFQSLVDALVRDESGTIAASARDQAIALAATRYSADRPATSVVDVVAADGFFLDLPAGWVAGFSRVLELECPPDRVPPVLIRPDRWSMYQGIAATRIMLADGIAGGTTVRIRFTIPHQVTDLVDTIPEQDREAVANWAAALLLDELANAFSGHSQPTIQADSVNHQSKGRDYGRRAETSRQLYLDHLGIDPKRNVAAGAVVTIPSRNSLGGPRLVHRRP